MKWFYCHFVNLCRGVSASQISHILLWQIFIVNNKLTKFIIIKRNAIENIREIEYFLSDYVAIVMAILRLVTTTCILIFSHVKLSYFYMWKYLEFLSGRNPDKTLVFI